MDRSPGLLCEADGRVVSQALEANNLAFYTTIVASGHARGVVIAVGDRTVMGRIAGRGEGEGEGEVGGQGAEE